MAKKEKIKKKGLQSALESIHEKWGKDALTILDEKPDIEVEPLPSGIPKLDEIIGVGGYPKGHIVEIFGKEGSGKSTIALHAVASAQALGITCAWIDAEHALDPAYARNLGVDTSKLFISQPSSAEEGLQLLATLIASGEVGLAVVDSVAALTPMEVMTGEIGDKKIAPRARLLGQAISMMVSDISKAKAVVLLLNQLRNTMGFVPSFMPAPMVTTGGMALKYYAHLRLEVTAIGGIKKGDARVGNNIKVKAVKNRVAPPYKDCELELVFGQGII